MVKFDHTFGCKNFFSNYLPKADFLYLLVLRLVCLKMFISSHSLTIFFQKLFLVITVFKHYTLRKQCDLLLRYVLTIIDCQSRGIFHHFYGFLQRLKGLKMKILILQQKHIGNMYDIF
jgi:hypothetical protein